VTASSPSLADRERRQLADLLDALGPDAPTCCPGWSTAHLAAHLVVRERRLDALPGYGLEEIGLAGPWSRWSHRAEERLRASAPYARVLARLRSGPPGWSPLAWPLVARVLNTAEFAIHHEDVRRAQPGWQPRTLPRATQDELWGPASLFARRAAARLRDGVVFRRSDVDGVSTVIAGGGTTVTGEPLELLLWAAGRRDVARVEVS
jgi:uncharacterized protein (TIGR03085 family)